MHCAGLTQQGSRVLRSPCRAWMASTPQQHCISKVRNTMQKAPVPQRLGGRKEAGEVSPV